MPLLLQSSVRGDPSYCEEAGSELLLSRLGHRQRGPSSVTLTARRVMHSPKCTLSLWMAVPQCELDGPLVDRVFGPCTCVACVVWCGREIADTHLADILLMSAPSVLLFEFAKSGTGYGSGYSGWDSGFSSRMLQPMVVECSDCMCTCTYVYTQTGAVISVHVLSLTPSHPPGIA